MIRREAKSSMVFRHWVRANAKNLVTCTLEMKDSRGKNYISFAEMKEEQRNFGMAIRGDKGVLIRTQGGNGEPDYIFLKGTPSFFVIKFPRSFEVIGVDMIEHELKKTKAKSLTSQRAKEISLTSIKF